MIKKVISVADIHIRNYKRNEEYVVQLNKFIDKCKEIVSDYKEDEVRIVVCGDLLHNKTEISPEAYALSSWFLRQLDEIAKTIVIAGNHDKTDNTSRLDPLSVVFSMCKFKQTYYLDKELDYQSGCIEDDNVIWCLYSAFDSFAKPLELNELRITKKDKTFVGLFHGEVKSAKTDVGFISENGVLVNHFNDTDFVLMGHIHKRQCIKNDGVPLVYSGSLIQQDYGENISGHGFIVLDINELTYEEYNIDNEENSFYTFSINTEQDIDDDKEEILNL